MIPPLTPSNPQLLTKPCNLTCPTYQQNNAVPSASVKSTGDSFESTSQTPSENPEQDADARNLATVFVAIMSFSVLTDLYTLFRCFFRR